MPLNVDYQGGLRADLDGARVIDDWAAGPQASLRVQDYLPNPAEIYFEKFATTPNDSCGAESPSRSAPFAAKTSIGATYDDGVRFFEGPSLVLEDWTAPPVETMTLGFGASTQLPVEYFQNLGGTQLQLTL